LDDRLLLSVRCEHHVELHLVAGQFDLGYRVANFEARRQAPSQIEGEGLRQIVVVNDLYESAEIDQRVFIAEVEGTFPVGRQRRLLQRQQ
jgi:hypothetical protein